MSRFPSFQTTLCAICLFGLAASMPAQTTNTPGTNQPATEGMAEVALETNAPANTNVWGAQPIPNQFETQNNMPSVAGPTFAGSGQAAFPLMGGTSLGAGPGFPAPTGPGLYRAGSVDVHANLGYSFLYATGLNAQPGQHGTTIENTVSPGVSVNVGSHLTLDYALSQAFYSGNSDYSDFTAQSAMLSWGAMYEDWAFGLSQSYSLSSEPLAETGTQTEEEAYVTALSVSRQLPDNFSMAIGLNQSFRFANQFDNVREWSGNGSLNYALSKKMQVGVSVAGGYDEDSASSAMTFESYQGDFMLHLGTKTTLNVSGGIEDSEFDAGGVPTLVSPIFSAALAYQLLPNTGISLSAARAVSPGFYANQVSIATSVAVSLQQRLSQKLSAAVTGSYGSASYQDILPGVQIYTIPFTRIVTTSPLEVTRTDDDYSIGVSLSYAFRARLSGSAYFSYGRNSSSEEDFSYSTTQIGLSLNYQY